MKIYLLTHQRELRRPSNTGRVAAEMLKDITETVLWERKYPDKELLKAINSDNTALLFNNTEGELVSDITEYENFIILDGTWQEARKIYNKSPYLKQMKTVTLNPDSQSVYRLRRNQKENGLCTAECVIELLKLKGIWDKAENLNKAFHEFMNKWNNKKSQP